MLFDPKYEVLTLGIGEERLEAEWPLPFRAGNGGPAVIKDAVDKIRQTFTFTFVYRSCRISNHRKGPMLLGDNVRRMIAEDLLKSGKACTYLPA